MCSGTLREKTNGAALSGSTSIAGNASNPSSEQSLPLAFVGLNADDVVASTLKAFGKTSQSGAEIDKALFAARTSANKVRQESVVVVGAFERCGDVASGVFAFHAALLLEKRLYLIIA